jgi:hypothetical protein
LVGGAHLFAVERAPHTLANTRRAVRAALANRGPDELCDVLLVASELVANALHHGCDPVRLLVHDQGHDTVVAVFDSAPVRRLRLRPGSGLQVVTYLCRDDWGVHEGDLGKWIWARVPRHDRPGIARHRHRSQRVPRGC